MHLKEDCVLIGMFYYSCVGANSTRVLMFMIDKVLGYDHNFV